MNEWESLIDFKLVDAIIETADEPFVPSSKALILKPFEFSLPESVKVVILGQDPYPYPGLASGLAFSVSSSVRKVPSSLTNLKKAIAYDFGLKDYRVIPNDLTYLAKQGVLLLNVHWTVKLGSPGSHRHLGWDIVTKSIVSGLSAYEHPKVFMFWGKSAQTLKGCVSKNNSNLVLEAPHPSGLSAHRGFLTCKHFSKANEFLKDSFINWLDF